MKTVAAIALLTLSIQSFAGVARVVGTGECSSTVPSVFSEAVQKNDLTECAESRALKSISDKCARMSQGWLISEAIGRREYSVTPLNYGRKMTVSVMALGQCEF